MEPESVPQITTPTREIPTVIATSGQCGPYGCRCKYCSPMIAHTATRTTPMVPRIEPNVRPDGTSRPMTRHQSRKVTSPNAMARIVKVDACDAELHQPEPMSGKHCAKPFASP